MQSGYLTVHAGRDRFTRIYAYQDRAVCASRRRASVILLKKTSDIGCAAPLVIRYYLGICALHPSDVKTEKIRLT